MLQDAVANVPAGHSSRQSSAAPHLGAWEELKMCLMVGWLFVSAQGTIEAATDVELRSHDDLSASRIRRTLESALLLKLSCCNRPSSTHLHLRETLPGSGSLNIPSSVFEVLLSTPPVGPIIFSGHSKQSNPRLLSLPSA